MNHDIAFAKTNLKEILHFLLLLTSLNWRVVNVVMKNEWLIHAKFLNFKLIYDIYMIFGNFNNFFTHIIIFPI